MSLEAVLLLSQENISEMDPNSHSVDDLGSILRHLNDHLYHRQSPLRHSAAVCGLIMISLMTIILVGVILQLQDDDEDMALIIRENAAIRAELAEIKTLLKQQ